MSASEPWIRHRALALLAEVWPELGSGEQPSCDRLDALLQGVTSTWRVVRASREHPSYEQAVIGGVIPSREGSWHDVFNVLAFARFPRTKQALHTRVRALQEARRASGQPGNDRGREEDALALIDECALVVAGTADAIAAYREVRAATLDVIDRVVRTQGIRVRVLGHALHEHLVLERPPISTTLVEIAVPEPFAWSSVDAALAEQIAEGGFPAPQREARLPWPDPVVDGWLD